MHLATKRTHTGLTVLFAVVALAFAIAPAGAQPDPVPFVIDHQLVYQVADPLPGAYPVTLMDQFIETQNEVIYMEKFSLPVDKNGEGILHPEWHYDWWRLAGDLSNPFPQVVVNNQFGEQSLDVGEAEYLLAPTLKNGGTGGKASGDLGTDAAIAFTPDHYKCYQVFGAPVQKDMALSHQFGTETNQALEPVYLCNPVLKKHAGAEFPINNPDDHLVCYRILPNIAFPVTVTVADQFTDGLVIFEQEDLICVPSTKSIPTQVQEQSWGSVKAIYR